MNKFEPEEVTMLDLLTERLQLQSALGAERAKVRLLREALRGLELECRAILSRSEQAIRNTAGNTNLAVLVVKMEKATGALAATEQEAK